jgi:hypothetical protein
MPPPFNQIGSNASSQRPAFANKGLHSDSCCCRNWRRSLPIRDEPHAGLLGNGSLRPHGAGHTWPQVVARDRDPRIGVLPARFCTLDVRETAGWSGTAASTSAVPSAIGCSASTHDPSGGLPLHVRVWGSEIRRPRRCPLPRRMFFYGAFAAKIVVVRSKRPPRWALPLAGGTLVTVVAVLWYTAALWHFNGSRLPIL